MDATAIEALAGAATPQPMSPTLDRTAKTLTAEQRAAAASSKLVAASQLQDEAAMASELAAMVEVPGFLRDTFQVMSSSRSYVYEDCMLKDKQDTVAVNHVLRNQVVSLAYLGVVDPQPFCQPARQVGGSVDMQRERFANTMEIHLAHQTGLMRFAPCLEGACQDASTNGYAVLKVTIQTDLEKDPIGGARFGDMQEQAAEYRRLKALVESGEIQEGTADHQKYKDVEQTLRVFVAGKIEEDLAQDPVMVPGMVPRLDQLGQPVVDPITLQPIMMPGMVPDPTDPREQTRIALVDGDPIDILGLPQLPHYQGFVCEQILPEDYRWDWRSTRPEDWANCEWQAQRQYMTPEEIQRKWGVNDDEMMGVNQVNRQGKSGGITQSNSTDQDPNIRFDVEAQQINDTLAVWEVWHRPTFRRYVFLPGMSRLLENEVPQAVGRRFFPFFHIWYNRVSGRAVPLSDVELVRDLQDEVNTLRSHDREARRAGYPVIFMPKDLMDAAAKASYRERMPFSVIEVNSADDINKYMKESTTVEYNPAIYSTAAAQSDMQAMFGLPAVVTGANSGEDLASALALAKEGMETGVARRRIQVNRTITEVFQWMAEISLKVFPLGYIQDVCGAGSVWPRMTAEQLHTNLRIEVKGGLSGQPRSKDRLDLLTNFAGIAQTLGLPVNGIEVMREMVDALGLRIDFTRLLGLQVPQGAGGTPSGPATGTPAGPDGGAPLMVDPNRGAPEAISQVPNHPPI